MKKNLFLFTLLITFWNVSFTQVYNHQLNLRERFIGKAQLGKVKIDSLIDNRTDKTACGQIWKYKKNSKHVSNVYLENDLWTFQEYFDDSCIKNVNYTPITMILNYLWLEEYPKESLQIATMDLEVLFCKKTKDNKLEIIHEYSGAIKDSSEHFRDIGNSHPHRLKKLIDEALLELDSTVLNTSTESYFNIRPLNKTQCIIKSNTNLKKGYYSNFTDFFNNTPNEFESTTSIVDDEYSDKYTLINSKTEKRVKRCYGFCDGVDIYLNARSYGLDNSKYYKKVISFGRYMLIDDKYVNKDFINPAGLMFGIAGMATAAAISLAAAKRGIVIDMETGEAIILSDKNFETLISKYPDVLKKYKKIPESEQSFQIFKTFIEGINKIEQEKK